MLETLNSISSVEFDDLAYERKSEISANMIIT